MKITKEFIEQYLEGKFYPETNTWEINLHFNGCTSVSLKCQDNYFVIYNTKLNTVSELLEWIYDYGKTNGVMEERQRIIAALGLFSTR